MNVNFKTAKHSRYRKKSYFVGYFSFHLNSLASQENSLLV